MAKFRYTKEQLLQEIAEILQEEGVEERKEGRELRPNILKELLAKARMNQTEEVREEV